MPRAAPPLPSLAKEDFELLADFRYKLRKFLGFSETAAVSQGVTPQQYQALLAIEGFPGRNWVTVGELAEQMQVAHHSAVGLVNRMQALRLVRRTPSKEDRRRVQVSLTAKGLAILEKLYRVHREELQSVGPQLIGLLRRASTPPGAEKPARSFSSPVCSLPEIED
ncbi:MAG: MarR family transcriptional regulator [Verrucomicrobiota bacterium]